MYFYLRDIEGGPYVGDYLFHIIYVIIHCCGILQYIFNTLNLDNLNEINKSIKTKFKHYAD